MRGELHGIDAALVQIDKGFDGGPIVIAPGIPGIAPPRGAGGMTAPPSGTARAPRGGVSAGGGGGGGASPGLAMEEDGAVEGGGGEYGAVFGVGPGELVDGAGVAGEGGGGGVVVVVDVVDFDGAV